jgi:hypothetical protein
MTDEPAALVAISINQREDAGVHFVGYARLHLLACLRTLVMMVMMLDLFVSGMSI